MHKAKHALHWKKTIHYSLGNKCHHYKDFVLGTHFVNIIVPTFSSLDLFITRVLDGVIHHLIYSKVIICRGRMVKFCHVMLQVTLQSEIS